MDDDSSFSSILRAFLCIGFVVVVFICFSCLLRYRDYCEGIVLDYYNNDYFPLEAKYNKLFKDYSELELENQKLKIQLDKELTNGD